MKAWQISLATGLALLLLVGGVSCSLLKYAGPMLLTGLLLVGWAWYGVGRSNDWENICLLGISITTTVCILYCTGRTIENITDITLIAIVFSGIAMGFVCMWLAGALRGRKNQAICLVLWTLFIAVIFVVALSAYLDFVDEPTLWLITLSGLNLVWSGFCCLASSIEREKNVSKQPKGC